MAEFTNEHMGQFKAVTDDMRFYADQRFKILTIFMITSGLLVNLAHSPHSIKLGLIGIILSLICFSWETATSLKWYSLLEGVKVLEKLAIENNRMIEMYSSLPQTQPSCLHRIAYAKPTHSVALIYVLGVSGWLYYIFS